ncbi:MULTISPECIES: HNH endonuclease signature motif containing protein [unclassified Micromonospora]|uniref:HNH endonuclease n=1 Tax=unclassified Micromonospora TaxID=2617518 RepID=UPI00331DA0B8
MSGGWAGSTRKSTLPANWYTEIRAAVIERDKGKCRWPRPNGRGICGHLGNQVDHKDDPLDHRLSNLQLLCERHHNLKSSRQGNEARAKLVSNRRPKPPHPGLL